MNRKLFILLLLFFQKGFAQQFFKRTQIQTTMGTIISSDSITPFLLRSNQYGLVPSKSGIGYLNLSLKKEYDSLYTNKRKLQKFGYGYSLETHFNFGKSNQMLLPVGFVKVRYGAFEIYGGRRREIQGLVDTTNTMGSYIWSGNALPMPKVEISIPNYTPIMKNGLLSIKGNFAHGWFGKGDSVQNVWLHQKSFYTRIGKPTWKFHLFGGFNHQVQWGGYPTNPFYDEISKQTITKFGSNFESFFKIVTGVRLNKDGIGLDNQPGVPSNEAGNRAGNHLGTLDFGIISNFSNTTVFVYKQSIYEDGSLFYLSNIVDGLYGFSVDRKSSFINKVLFEFFYSLNQGGDAFEYQPELRGRDNYFNNSLYRDNWTYRNMEIGIPLIVLNTNFNNKSRNSYLLNRARAYNLNFHYSLKKINIRTQIIYSTNFGTYYNPSFLKQTSIRQDFEYSRNKYIFSFNIGFDSGNYNDNIIGTNFKILKTW